MQGWAMTEAKRREVLDRMYGIATDPDVEPRYAIPAAKACMAADVLASQDISRNVIEADFERIDDRNIEQARAELSTRLARLADSGADVGALLAGATGRAVAASPVG